jgi:hypothetical protein
VLTPGGITIHQDVPIRAAPSIAHQIERGWDERFNGEVFWNTYAGDDLLADLLGAGFTAEESAERCIPKLAGAGDWYLLIGEKSA